MPRTEEQFKALREQKRLHIMDTALELFAEKGFSSTSINMIATHASISKGLIYNYFESKEELIKTIIHDGFDKFLVEFDANKDGVLTKEEFEYFIDSSFEILRSSINFWKIYFMVIAQPEVMKLVEEKLMELVTPFIKILSEYFEAEGYENPLAYASLFGAMMDGVSLNFMVNPENFPLDQIKNIIKDKFI
jgi:AcrR family transcriptional regulator